MKRTLKVPSFLLVAVAASAMATGAFAADPTVKLKVRPDPLEVCPVSGEKLDSMGDAFVFAVGDQEVQLCCKSCQKDFDKDKATYLKKIEEAWTKVKRYPLKTCISSDEALDPAEAVGLVYQGREFMFCCKSCIKDFKKEPAKFVKKFDEALAKKGKS